MVVRPSVLRLRRLAMPVIAAAYLGYFGFHAFHGSYGVFAMTQLRSDAETLTAELATLSAERDALDARAARLRDASLDRDMIDERARRSLNYLNPNDVVIMGAVQHALR